MDKRYWPLLGALGGAAGGAFDFALFLALGLDRGRSGLALLAVIFALNMAILGFALGHLALARAKARGDAATIRAQYEALERTHRAAAQAEKLAALGRVAAGIAHEVRNPLGVIRASASLIEEDLGDTADDKARACRFIVEECDRLDRLVGGLLLFARPGDARTTRFTLDAVIERTLHLARSALGKKVAVQDDTPVALPAVVGDPDLIQQVLFGLVVNAAEAGAKTVTLRARARDGALSVEVTDDGPGVPAAHAETVFEPFFTTKESGTGLGLPTAARIAEAHGGSLTLRRDHPRGACFVLSLPADAGRAP
jgi:signal transduction histidine kinase